ncbi:MAG TPA: site-specific integrase [Candidatus Saccharibacteria bacterium]|nr:site-specific integrase [Candidatus Saccharibacteria bacterium]
MQLVSVHTKHYDVADVFSGLDVSEATRKDYEYRIEPFLAHLRSEPFTTNTFLNYKRKLSENVAYSVSTKNKYLASARIFLKELHRRGVIPIDTTLNIKSFSQNKKHKVSGLDDSDIEKLTNYLKSAEPTPQNLRLKAMVALLLYQGLRQIEIVRLNVEDIELASKRAYVIGKGRNDKEPINLHPETAKAIHSYLRMYKKTHGALFTPITRQPTDRLTTRGLRKIIQRAMVCADIDKTVHGFRHYYTTRLIRSYRGDLLRVACYTRHRSIEMLQVYNDSILEQDDLPKYYAVFDGVNLN